ncbi:hypothetical protein, partial [Vibrio parahaemolyticus]|uniref:hypothetical protein n=1 Tax=Vibrio parahaemolyticus TaxID=670 RepID=UPI001EEBEE55
DLLSDWSQNGQRCLLRKRFRLGDRMIEEKGRHFTLFFENRTKSPFSLVLCGVRDDRYRD